MNGSDAHIKNLILRSQSGNLEAFEELVRLFQGAIIRLATYLVGPDQADDVAQDVFVRVYRGLGAYRFRASFSTWLYRVSLNVCYDRLRSVKRRRSREVSYEDRIDLVESEGLRAVGSTILIPDEALQSRELALTVRESLAQLSDKHRNVLVLHDIEGLTYDEIAAVVGCFPGTVKSRLFYARAHLKQLLEEYLRA